MPSPLLSSFNPPEIRDVMPPLQVGVVGSASQYRLPHRIHFVPLLVLPRGGTLTVQTRLGVWVVPAGWGVWIPVRSVHDVIAPDGVSLVVVYVQRRLGQALPETCRVVAVSPLLHALIDFLHQREEPYRPVGRIHDAMSLALHELSQLQEQALYLPLPTHRALRRLTDALVDNTDDGRDLRDWATVVGASPRNLTRLFLNETGLTFRQWRTRARILKALNLFDAGLDVTRVSDTLGYSDPSAFAKAFKRVIGITPSGYRRVTRLAP
jgi:AraC-like DNA-binding protein